VTTSPTELARVLAALDESGDLVWMAEDAARLLRALAADFEKYSAHTLECNIGIGDAKPCDCGLDSARARWRLDEERHLGPEEGKPHD